jgi:rubrerythrin
MAKASETMGGDMDRKSLLQAFRIAIDNEVEAARFYGDLAGKADDPEMKKLFQRFVREEESHRDSLTELYRSLRGAVPEE